jgi:uncharacterized SAM-binding protein YcdF (DUF218 family)
VYFLATAAALLVTFSSGKTATLLFSPLEYAYTRVPQQVLPVRAIVVLAAYATNEQDMPLSSRLNDSAMFRIVEAVHLWRRCRDCTVVVTGSSPTVDVMAEALVPLGVPHTQVQLDTDAGDTGDSATNVRRMLGNAPFYLVTSAGHMPRAMAVFAKVGMQPVPAPTDYQLPKLVAKAEWRLSVFHLKCSDLAVHERVGMWWYRVRGRI